ncbi:capsular exopolysaccharide synthesis family protein [Virgibacillus natechei]|uniref:non-specific protein-tyrosine kinase n=1 Tax=Virgibacillus natechei TaxID=1216297 RepID=A0ABS4IE38_9BACI|nr:CpsD/CapB family tyrosine-protein kinase [Virgibacillus natechei]MBP1969202.1 capsular exopolysaccharide synthesis family protein [Virgibacillus natechei]UZD14969.1 CpsD/CapB family tyrosine-protein kinase [Virgibacillus natechei]
MARRKNQSRPNKMRHLITKLNPKSPVSEQYRTVRTNLQFASVDNDLKSMIVTSSGPGEGKSMTTANLAVVYAQQGKKVLLIDADLRKPTAHYTFRLDNLRGLSNILVGEHALEETVNRTEMENLDVISCGPIPPNPSELLGSRKMQSLLKEATMSYDLVIFDTPPVLAVTDAQILADIVDGSILVIRSNVTEYEPAEKAKEALEPAHAKLLGTVLNDREKKASNYYYYYGTN